ncbi:nicotinamide mononucleotide transporter [Schleiferiaceae bacterium]|nr:nicotinamide mononucleotide transporter [Schleiferiaceae bacterium]
MKQVFLRLKNFLESTYLDIIGVTLVVGGSFYLGFHKTEVNGLPIGWFSTIGVGFSMVVTRMVTKRKNIGNLIGLGTAINSAFVDYSLGNDAAILTYPISFLGAGITYVYWKRRSNKIPRKIDFIFFLNIGAAFVLAVTLNYIGFTDFLKAPLGEKMSKFIITSAITAITYSGILNTPRMYADTWASWQMYNILKLYQNILFGNVAFVLKYIFYLFNAALAWIVWHAIRKKGVDS